MDYTKEPFEPSTSPNTVFIVEDNEDIGFILEYYLQEEGFIVSLFPTIADFRKIYPASIPDIFLVDVMLPDGDGIQLCNEIKNKKSGQHLPVLIMSAHAPAEKIAMESRANGFIKKPFDLDHVKERLLYFLNLGGNLREPVGTY